MKNVRLVALFWTLGILYIISGLIAAGIGFVTGNEFLMKLSVGMAFVPFVAFFTLLIVSALMYNVYRLFTGKDPLEWE